MMKIAHLLWIIPLASSFGAVAMAILGFDRFDDECDIKIVSKDELMKDIPDVNGIVGAGPPDDSGRSGPLGWFSEKKRGE